MLYCLKVEYDKIKMCITNTKATTEMKYLKVK